MELGEVEWALSRQPCVRDAVAVVREDGPAPGRLVAYVTSRDGASIDGVVLKEALKRTLPDYMVPSVVVGLTQLPLSANGKLDRLALPVPQVARDTEVFIPAQDELEATIAGAWGAVLQVPQVGMRDTFFDLGGDSLLLLRLHGRLREALAPRELSVVDLFEHPTVASQASHVRQTEARQPRVPAAGRTERLQEGRARLGRLRDRSGPRAQTEEGAP